MSTPPTAQDIDTMDNNDLELLKEQSARLKAQAEQLALLEKAKADADLALLANTTTSFSPLPVTNLSNSLTAVAPVNEQRVFLGVEAVAVGVGVVGCGRWRQRRRRLDRDVLQTNQRG